MLNIYLAVLSLQPDQHQMLMGSTSDMLDRLYTGTGGRVWLVVMLAGRITAHLHQVHSAHHSLHQPSSSWNY